MSDVELFRPSNGTHGESFHEGFCYQCAKFPHNMDAKNQCSIWQRAQMFDIDDKEYPRQWCYVDGEPACTAFKSREEFNAERRASRRGTLTKPGSDDLFSAANIGLHMGGEL